MTHRKFSYWRRLVMGTAFLILSSPLSLLAAGITYEETVRPLFKEHCLKCHSEDEKKADLDLSTYTGVLAGGSGGEIVKAGSADSSVLYLSVIHDEDAAEPMPPKKPKLPDAQLEIIRQWIQEGLVENSGGKSMLRSIEFDGTAGSSNRPDGPPPMPEDLPKIDLAKTVRPPAIVAMALSPWAPLSATSGEEQVILRNTETGEALGILPFPEGTIHQIRFSRNGTLLLVAGGIGGKSGSVILFEIKTGKRIAEIGEETDAVLAADISADHRFVALGGPAKIVKVYDVKTGELRHRFDKHTDWITALAFAPEGDHFASADRNGGIHVWEAEKGAIVFSLDEHKSHVTALSWRSDGQMLASAGNEGKLVLWDMKDGWPSKVIDAHKGQSESRYTRASGVLALNWARDGQLITAGRDRRVCFWKPDGTLAARSPELETLPTAAELDPQSGLGWIGAFDGRLRRLSPDAKRFDEVATK